MPILDPQTFVYGSSFIFGGYALQMLAMPANMVTDHFDSPATPLLKFWIRGSSIPIFASCFACLNLDAQLASRIMLFTTASIAVLYPANAKFNLIGEKLPVKYPWHYVPEGLMAGLTVAGFLTLI